MKTYREKSEESGRITISGPNKEYNFELWFDDLKSEIQNKLLKAAKIEDPSDANWDAFPIAEVFLSDEYDGN